MVLCNVGGVWLDVDILVVELCCNGKFYKIDMCGVFEGCNMVDVMFLIGD